MKLALPRSTPVIAVAIACLLLGSATGAVAVSMITGKQIKNGTVTTKDLKNGTVKAKDLSKAARQSLKGAAGPAGATGATGPSGPAGPRGSNSWDTIPSGTTVTGRFYDLGARSDPAFYQLENVEFPGRAPSVPTGYGFGEDAFGDALTELDPACTGTFKAPTAPPGRVCVYLQNMTGLTDLAVLGWVEPEHAVHAFNISFADSDDGGSYTYWGSWAYTAP